MPQMSPLNWLLLFMMFTIIYLLFNIINYFSNLKLPSPKQTYKTSIKFNWKW
uniref:ATP synthase complex subunit 8 n=1 Tax=Nanophyes sp. CG271 TaxID=2480752 RepID=A0A3G2JZE4_9CUCU|nr:ATP synthase F0 subunit 8 [Nanophyes sp. CG271]